jgi:hypothetical protein
MQISLDIRIWEIVHVSLYGWCTSMIFKMQISLDIRIWEIVRVSL